MIKEDLSMPESARKGGSGESITVQMEFTQEEREIFVDVLDTCLSDLRMEIAHTDRQDFREILKVRKRIIMKVLDKLI